MLLPDLPQTVRRMISTLNMLLGLQFKTKHLQKSQEAPPKSLTNTGQTQYLQFLTPAQVLAQVNFWWCCPVKQESLAVKTLEQWW